MDKFLINGGKKLFGEVEVPKAKNSYLAILAGCVLCSGEVVLHKCPKFDDIDNMLFLLENLGCKVKRQNRDVYIDCRYIKNGIVPKEIAHKIRSSIFLLGPLLGRLKQATVAYPGGCEIGARPIDLHLKGLRALGANIVEKFGDLQCETKGLTGNEVHLDYPSVGATENIMMAGVLAKGTTKIYNCAKEPEIVDLQNFLNSMGAKIYGGGTDTIVVEGVKKLNSTDFCPMSDRIIAGTYLLATATCGGDILVKNVDYTHIYSLLTKLKDAGFELTIKDDTIRLLSSKIPLSFGKIDTMPYPGFPTDLQPQALVLQTISKGTCVITENLFETRLKHTPELVKMGANIITKDRTAVVVGVKELYGAEVVSTDLRAGAALTIAGLRAQGQTIVTNVHNIDRGYENLEKVFSMLGADISRI